MGTSAKSQPTAACQPVARSVRWLPYDAAEIVARTARAQGLPPRLTDREALARIAKILRR